MIINEKITKFFQTNKTEPTTVTINKNLKQNVDIYKYLGVLIIRNLISDWQRISQRFNSTLYLIKNPKKSIPTKSTSQKIKDEMESLQKRFLRVIGIESDNDDSKK